MVFILDVCYNSSCQTLQYRHITLCCVSVWLLLNGRVRIGDITASSQASLLLDVHQAMRLGRTSRLAQVRRDMLPEVLEHVRFLAAETRATCKLWRSFPCHSSDGQATQRLKLRLAKTAREIAKGA